jgi:hypothetical protein
LRRFAGMALMVAIVELCTLRSNDTLVRVGFLGRPRPRLGSSGAAADVASSGAST